MAAEDLDLEWEKYRRACNRVDLFRYHPAFNDGGDLTERLDVAESRAKLLDVAVRASEQLLAAAEQQKTIDFDWLKDLRESHAELRIYEDDTQRLIRETQRRLHPPR